MNMHAWRSIQPSRALNFLQWVLMYIYVCSSSGESTQLCLNEERNNCNILDWWYSYGRNYYWKDSVKRVLFIISGCLLIFFYDAIVINYVFSNRKIHADGWFIHSLNERTLAILIYNASINRNEDRVKCTTILNMWQWRTK